MHIDRRKADRPRNSDLKAETERVFAAGRALLGVEEFNADTAPAAAEAVMAQLRALPPEARRARWREILSVIEDLHALRNRLAERQEDVGEHLHRIARQRTAGRAYRQADSGK